MLAAAAGCAAGCSLFLNLPSRETLIVDELLDIYRGAVAGDTRAVWFLAAAYTLIVCAYSLVYQLRMRNWSRTHGKLEGHEVTPFGTSGWPLSERSYKARAQYRYEVGGREYTGTRVSPWDVVASHNLRGVLRWQLRGLSFDENGRVVVFFNPRRPRKSVLILPSVGGMFATALIGCAPWFFYYLVY